MRALTYLFSGVLFGVGLILSGMTDPAKVIDFLDVTGVWDPSLAFVMLGAISITFFAFKVAKNRRHSYLGLPMLLPSAHLIDAQLIVGASLFGIGWGLAGFCPGPGIASILTGNIDAMLFVLAMVIGMSAYEGIEYLRSKRSP